VASRRAGGRVLSPRRATYLKRILVADDEPNVCRLIQVNLERAGYTVEMVFNGADALAAIRRDRPALVIANILMSQLDGFELLSVLRRAPGLQDMPVILVLATEPPDRTGMAGYAGAAAYLTKPFNPADLIATIRGLLGEDWGGASGAPAPRTPPPSVPPAAQAERPKKRRDGWEV
jgi:DNA-binding response OmpR family regulator